MKIIRVFGDGDYAVLNLENHPVYGKMSHKELWDLAIKEEEGLLEITCYLPDYEEDDECDECEESIYVEAYDYNIIVNEDMKMFIDFLNGEKDYDATKHCDWFLIED